MLYRLALRLRGETWRDVVRPAVEPYLRDQGESVDREIAVERWPLRWAVWVRVGPGPEERAELERSEGLVAGSGDGCG